MARGFEAAYALLVAMMSVVAHAAAAPPTCPPLPDDMRAARIHAAGGPEALRVERIALPRPGRDDVLVRVRNASINPVDWKLQEAGRLPMPATPGGDFAGEVVAVGAGVEGVACGMAVVGIANPRGHGGSYAEYVSVPAGQVAAKPPAYSFAEAAAYPTVAVAAWRYLVATADLQAGERVLIHGGAGGVGSVAIQIAKARGAYVIATASARNLDFMRSIGADEVVDYRAVRFEDVVKDVDVVVDTVGGDTLRRSPAVLRDGGRLVTLVGSVPPELCTRVRCPAAAPWDVGRGLGHVAPLIAGGALRIHIDRLYPLAAVVAAQQFNREGRTRGKVVLDIAPEVAPAAR